jgi:hypothetical protein
VRDQNEIRDWVKYAKESISRRVDQGKVAASIQRANRGKAKARKQRAEAQAGEAA